MIYEVLVKPNSKKGPLILQNTHTLTVYLREKPVDGAANAALIKLLAQYFHVSQSCITIKTGTHGRKKLVEIT